MRRNDPKDELLARLRSEKGPSEEPDLEVVAGLNEGSIDLRQLSEEAVEGLLDEAEPPCVEHRRPLRRLPGIRIWVAAAALVAAALLLVRLLDEDAERFPKVLDLELARAERTWSAPPGKRELRWRAISDEARRSPISPASAVFVSSPDGVFGGSLFRQGNESGPAWIVTTIEAVEQAMREAALTDQPPRVQIRTYSEASAAMRAARVRQVSVESGLAILSLEDGPPGSRLGRLRPDGVTVFGVVDGTGWTSRSAFLDPEGARLPEAFPGLDARDRRSALVQRLDVELPAGFFGSGLLQGGVDDPLSPQEVILGGVVLDAGSTPDGPATFCAELSALEGLLERAGDEPFVYPFDFWPVYRRSAVEAHRIELSGETQLLWTRKSKSTIESLVLFVSDGEPGTVPRPVLGSPLGADFDIRHALHVESTGVVVLTIVEGQETRQVRLDGDGDGQVDRIWRRTESGHWEVEESSTGLFDGIRARERDILTAFRRRLRGE